MLDLDNGKVWADDAILITEYVDGSYTVKESNVLGYDALVAELHQMVEREDVVRSFVVVGETEVHIRTAHKPMGK